MHHPPANHSSHSTPNTFPFDVVSACWPGVSALCQTIRRIGSRLQLLDDDLDNDEGCAGVGGDRGIDRECWEKQGGKKSDLCHPCSQVEEEVEGEEGTLEGEEAFSVSEADATDDALETSLPCDSLCDTDSFCERGRLRYRMAGPNEEVSNRRRRRRAREEEEAIEKERRRLERRKRREDEERKERHRLRKLHEQRIEAARRESAIATAATKKKNRLSVEDVLGLSSSVRSRSVSIRRPIRVRSQVSLRASRSEARLRSESRLKVIPERSRGHTTIKYSKDHRGGQSKHVPATADADAGEQPQSQSQSQSRRRHKRHDDHSTPEAKAVCRRCIRKHQKKEEKKRLSAAVSTLSIEVVPASIVEPRKVDLPKVEKKAGPAPPPAPASVSPTLRRSKQVLGFVIEKKPEKLVECVTCLADDIPHKEAAHLACGHSWCNECLKRIFTLSLTDPSHMPPKCCTDDHVPLKHVDKLLSYQTKKLWNKKYIEYTTANRIYCPEVNCGEWIQPKDIRDDIGKCQRCKTKVCAICNGKAHGDGECPKDEDLMKFIEIAKKNKFQRCYSCRAVVELERGCNHMTYIHPPPLYIKPELTPSPANSCLCTAEFCYVCGEKWKTCNCPWFNYEPEEDDYVAPVWNANAPPPPAAAAAPPAAAARRAQQLLDDEELARRIAQEEAPATPTAAGDFSGDGFYPSPLGIDPLAALGTIGTGLRNGIRRLAAEYVEAAGARSPTPPPPPPAPAPAVRTARRRDTRSREEIRENLVNLIQEVEEMSRLAPPPPPEAAPSMGTVPVVVVPAPPPPPPPPPPQPQSQPRPQPQQAPTATRAPPPPRLQRKYLSEARQTEIEEYIRNTHLSSPLPSPPPSPPLTRARWYDDDWGREYASGRWPQYVQHPMFRRGERERERELPRRWGAERRGY